MSLMISLERLANSLAITLMNENINASVIRVIRMSAIITQFF